MSSSRSRFGHRMKRNRHWRHGHHEPPDPLSNFARTRSARNVQNKTPSGSLQPHETTGMTQDFHYLRLPQLLARYGCARATIYVWMASGSFPKPVKLGTRLIAWRSDHLEAWESSRGDRGGTGRLQPAVANPNTP